MRVRLGALALGVVSAVTVACGSRVERAELQAANGLLAPTVAARGGSPVSEAARPVAGGEVQPNTMLARGEAVPMPRPAKAPAARSLPAASGPSAVPAPTGTGRAGERTVAATGWPLPEGAAGASVPSANDGGPPAAIAPSRKSEIVLGSIGTASGPLGANARPVVVGNRAWVADVNARGGLNGHPVRVVYGDDGSDPARALALARQMVEREKVVAFFGNYMVTTTQAVTPYLEERRIPMVGGPSGNEIEDASPMVFNPQMGPDSGLAWSYLATVQVQTRHRKVAVFYCREGSVCSSTLRRIKEFLPLTDGMKLVLEAQVSLAQPDYTAEVMAARNAGAEAVLTIVDPASTVRMVRAARRQGWDATFVLSHGGHIDQLVRAGADADGILLASSTVPYMTAPELAPYRAAVARYQPGGELGGLGAAAWAQGKLFEVIAPRLSEPVTKDQILAALYEVRNETLGGVVPPITFNRGPHRFVNQCFVPIRVRGGRFIPHDGNNRGFVCPPGFIPGDPDGSRSAWERR